MQRRTLSLLALAVWLGACSSGDSTGSSGGLALGLEPVAQGFDFPVFLTARPGDPDHVFVVEKGGVIRALGTDGSIQDRSRNTLIEPFYRGLADGLPATEALQRAKLEAIQNGASPAVWASFTLIGDPLARVPLERPTSRSASVVGVLIGLVVVALIAQRRVRALRS
jgi:hypothetical protein